MLLENTVPQGKLLWICLWGFKSSLGKIANYLVNLMFYIEFPKSNKMRI